jgi:tetratricopeptide (TPR) repeat protein
LPATAVEEQFVSAVLGLEKAGRFAAAVEGYKAALSLWPSSLGALMGLGNSYYELGDNKAAANTFRLATRRFPTEGSTFNNLAQVLWKQGKHNEAVEAAKKAVEAGGPLINIYRETLGQIQSEKP